MTDYPIRQKSAQGQPRPTWNLLRSCKTCGADFGSLVPGKTGEAGIWDDSIGLVWYCSVECAPGRPASTAP